MAHADHVRDHGVPARLRQQAPPRIDQNDGEIGVRGAARGVARIAFVARRIGDDEAAARRRKIAVGNVDGNALFALVLQAIDQQRKIDRLTAVAEARQIPRQRREFIVGDRAGLVQQAADQR